MKKISYKNKRADYPLYSTVYYTDMRDMLVRCADRFEDRPALSYRCHPGDADAVRLSYRTVYEEVAALATALLARGLSGKKIALIGENSREWIFAYFAITSMGAVVVPIDKEYPAADMVSILNTARCDALIFSPTIKEKLEPIKEQVKTLSTFISFSPIADEIPALDTLVAEGKAALAEGSTTFADTELDADALVSIVFTSGTTGKGKGVMLSTRNILEDMSNGIYLFRMPEKTIFALPAHHTFGSTVNLVGHYMQGLEIYINSGTRYILNELKQEDPTHLILVPLYIETFYKKVFAGIEKKGKLKLVRRMMKLSNALRRIGIDLREKLFAEILSNFGSRMRLIVSGGAALNPDIIRDFDALGITILNGYGITECAPLISCNRNNYRKAGTVGRPILGEEVRIDAPNENGEGEICVKGSNVMLGYFEDDTATAAVFDEDGYFHTGDIGKIDKDGWITITGRSKNLIILSNGKNVYPEEIETELSRIYGSGEVVVYEGKSRSDSTKQLIVAEIFPDAEALERRGITDYESYFHREVAQANENMVHYKRVEHIKLRDTEFPKTTTRKITRFALDKTVD